VGDNNPANNNLTDFNQWYFWEPQTNQEVSPGDFSMNEDAHVNIKWYGKYLNGSQAAYGNRNIVQFNLTNGVPTLTYPHPNLVTSWTPSDQVDIPQDQNYEFSTTLNTDTSVTGVPTNLYPGMNVTRNDSSTQTNNLTATDVNFDIYRDWEFSAGAYDTTFTQTISVTDNTSPYTTSFPNDTIINEGEDLSSGNLGSPQYVDNSNLPVIVDYNDVLVMEDNFQIIWERTWLGTDISGNESIEEIQIITVLKPQSIGEVKTRKYVVYPNPGNGFAKIYPADFTAVKVFNCTEFIITDKAINTKQNLDFSLQAPGIYLIQIVNKNGRQQNIKYVKY